MTVALDDLLRLDECWLCQAEAPAQFWRSGQWVASTSEWEKFTGGGVGRLRRVWTGRRRGLPMRTSEMLLAIPPKTPGLMRGIKCQWMTGKFVEATTQLYPPGCTGVRKDQVRRASAEEIERAKAACPQCGGHGKRVLSLDEAFGRQAWCTETRAALEVWADRAMSIGDPRGEQVASRLAREDHDEEAAPW